MTDHESHPAQHGESLPNLLEGQLDREQCAKLFSDLSESAQVLHVQVRPTVAREGDRKTSLHEAQRMLDSGNARRVQIRYNYKGDTWCDTLVVLNAGVRLVRMCQSSRVEQKMADFQESRKPLKNNDLGA